MLDPPSPRYHTFQMKTESCICVGCCEPITDKYLLQVSGRPWHTGCLRCSVCQLALDREASCFVRDHSVYCKQDYAKSFGAKCSKCSRSISSRDWVRKAREHVYHLACFACEACKRQLSTGEEFALHEDRVLCKAHYMETVDGATTSSDGGGAQAGLGGGRDLGDSSPFGRHINLHLTYSFQQQSAKSSPAYQPQHTLSETSSLDELSQESMLMCPMRGEGGV
ncbi:unnamed protein product [Nezara viridula]|uniref:LIM zinc-binding domain-containing protein n=1 Tax=Nezara viridula TaxID=85310 RepID=A0A9P0EI45_NEZVI|nr:unnamed protein product [Nezara viridula]